ncbi:MAG TPA: hypothetical protein VI320_21940 [Terracidiphilus sp.]
MIPVQPISKVEDAENTKNCEAIISWITFSGSGEKVLAPIRLAGTWRQYSKNAVDQLANITFQRATSLNFK